MQATEGQFGGDAEHVATLLAQKMADGEDRDSLNQYKKDLLKQRDKNANK